MVEFQCRRFQLLVNFILAWAAAELFEIDTPLFAVVETERILVRVPSDVIFGCPPAVSPYQNLIPEPLKLERFQQLYLKHMIIRSSLTQLHQSSENRNQDCRSRSMQITFQHHQAASIFDRL
ncbi:hypothetical protein PHYSODRAFT_522734 [Phytophthora sojae]|uniref:Uncharacterized protein n=1 Tax=Phytophthora sojae (strain P6497) TaxID=1094619 RepID=G5A480_PHYSP|nr:hypothetical protein PHYSODRAFT_522734 [Phytophthora sojae]EGZ09526.1 hypothetical protein PHYSODRAFT_522734 [Phytophthora sojae]|eukprot:XP_009534387.1 hypothetical protein PHYSODRAFT_522734 [Phytophthora sojae]